MKLGTEGKLIRDTGQTLSIASTKIWNVLNQKEATGVLTVIEQVSQEKQQLMTNLVRAVKETTVSDITINEGITIHRSRKPFRAEM